MQYLVRRSLWILCHGVGVGNRTLCHISFFNSSIKTLIVFQGSRGQSAPQLPASWQIFRKCSWPIAKHLGKTWLLLKYSVSSGLVPLNFLENLPLIPDIETIQLRIYFSFVVHLVCFCRALSLRISNILLVFLISQCLAHIYDFINFCFITF